MLLLCTALLDAKGWHAYGSYSAALPQQREQDGEWGTDCERESEMTGRGMDREQENERSAWFAPVLVALP